MIAFVLILFAAGPVKGSVEKCDGGELRECAYVAMNRMDYGKRDEARTLAKKACDGGEQLGCVVLGHLERGDDEASAVRRYEAACDHKEPAGCVALMSVHSDPNGKRHDPGLAEDD
ncbi:MAG: hypothetical protein ACJ790_21110, partial [Myxococcaceae bacterium]